MKLVHLLAESGISRTVIEIVRQSSQDLDLVLHDDSEAKIGKSFSGIKCVNTVDYLLNKTPSFFFNCIGNFKQYRIRIDLNNQLLNRGWSSINFLHPSSAIASSARLGEGILLNAHTFVGTNVILSGYNIVFAGTMIEHDSIIGAHSYLSPNVTICGKVNVGANCYIGPGVTIGSGIKIGKNCIVGAGSVVLRDIPDNCFVYGTPASLIGRNKYWGDL